MTLLRRFQAARLAGSLPRLDLSNPADKARQLERFRELGPDGIPPLLRCLGGPGRAAARVLLAELLDDETLPMYLSELSVADASAGAALVETIGAGQRYDAARLLDLFADTSVPRARVEALLVKQGARIPSRLILDRVADLPREARGSAFRLLEQNATGDDVPALVRLTTTDDAGLRGAAAKILARIPGADSISALIRLTKDEARAVRLDSVQALGRLSALAAIPALCETLRDSDIKVQTAAIEALTKIGDPAAVPHLVDVLKDESEQARRGAVEVLNEVVTVEAIKDLVGALRDADWWVRVRAADALGTLGGPRVVEAIIGLMSDTDEFIRRYAVEILNTIPDARAVEPLLEALNDADWWVRERSIDALGRIADPRAVDRLIEVAQRDVRCRPLCVKSLGDIGDLRAVEFLARLLNSVDAETRAASEEALREIGRKCGDDEARGRIAAQFEAVGLSYDRRPGAILGVRQGRVFTDPGTAPRRAPESHPAPGTPSTGTPAGGHDSGARAPEALDAPTQRDVGGLSRPQMTNFHDLKDGQLLLDRYRILRRIGGGGFGTVYLTTDSVVGDEVILKVLSPQFSLEPTMLQRFIQELKLARRITHQNVIRIHDFIDLDGAHAISMEFFPGRELAQLVREDHPLTVRRCLGLFEQISAGLGAAHAQGIVHRDVKPANCLVGAADDVKLLDFGLAAATQQVGSRLTRSGLLMGTPEYMAPEVITGNTIDHRADIYSLGILMYEVLAGERPFHGESAVNILFQHLEGNVKPLRSVRDDIEPEVEQIVMDCMNRDREARPESMEAVIQRIQSLLERAA